jgi:uncharacterized protein DUF5681
MIGRPFPPGQSGNPKGRPKGSRHKLSEAIFQGVYPLDLDLLGQERGDHPQVHPGLLEPAARSPRGCSLQSLRTAPEA